MSDVKLWTKIVLADCIYAAKHDGTKNSKNLLRTELNNKIDYYSQKGTSHYNPALASELKKYDIYKSNQDMACFVNQVDKTAVVSFAGTRLCFRDIANDIVLSFGPRFNTASEFMGSVMKELGSDFTWHTTGHSLGGSLAMTVGAKHGVASTVFNPGYTPWLHFNFMGKDLPENISVYRTGADLVSFCIEFTDWKVNYCPSSGWIPILHPHLMSNFIKYIDYQYSLLTPEQQKALQQIEEWDNEEKPKEKKEEEKDKEHHPHPIPPPLPEWIPPETGPKYLEEILQMIEDNPQQTEVWISTMMENIKNGDIPASILTSGLALIGYGSSSILTSLVFGAPWLVTAPYLVAAGAVIALMAAPFLKKKKPRGVHVVGNYIILVTDEQRGFDQFTKHRYVAEVLDPATGKIIHKIKGGKHNSIEKAVNSLKKKLCQKLKLDPNLLSMHYTGGHRVLTVRMEPDVVEWDKMLKNISEKNSQVKLPPLQMALLLATLNPLNPDNECYGWCDDRVNGRPVLIQKDNKGKYRIVDLITGRKTDWHKHHKNSLQEFKTFKFSITGTVLSPDGKATLQLLPHQTHQYLTLSNGQKVLFISEKNQTFSKEKLTELKQLCENTNSVYIFQHGNDFHFFTSEGSLAMVRVANGNTANIISEKFSLDENTAQVVTATLMHFSTNDTVTPANIRQQVMQALQLLIAQKILKDKIVDLKSFLGISHQIDEYAFSVHIQSSDGKVDLPSVLIVNPTNSKPLCLLTKISEEKCSVSVLSQDYVLIQGKHHFIVVQVESVESVTEDIFRFLQQHINTLEEKPDLILLGNDGNIHLYSKNQKHLGTVNIPKKQANAVKTETKMYAFSTPAYNINPNITASFSSFPSSSSFSSSFSSSTFLSSENQDDTNELPKQKDVDENDMENVDFTPGFESRHPILDIANSFAPISDKMFLNQPVTVINSALDALATCLKHVHPDLESKVEFYEKISQTFKSNSVEIIRESFFKYIPGMNIYSTKMGDSTFEILYMVDSKEGTLYFGVFLDGVSVDFMSLPIESLRHVMGSLPVHFLETLIENKFLSDQDKTKEEQEKKEEEKKEEDKTKNLFSSEVLPVLNDITGIGVSVIRNDPLQVTEHVIQAVANLLQKVTDPTLKSVGDGLAKVLEVYHGDLVNILRGNAAEYSFKGSEIALDIFGRKVPVNIVFDIDHNAGQFRFTVFVNGTAINMISLPLSIGNQLICSNPPLHLSLTFLRLIWVAIHKINEQLLQMQSTTPKSVTSAQPNLSGNFTRAEHEAIEDTMLAISENLEGLAAVETAAVAMAVETETLVEVSPVLVGLML